MSYKDVDFTQEVLSEQRFIDVVKEFPEKCFVGKNLRGILSEVYVLANGVFDEKYFVKTTVSDVLDTCGGINIAWVTGEQGECQNGFVGKLLYKLSVANQKQYRGKLKFTPRNTLSLKIWVVGDGKDGDAIAVPIGDFPVLQDEKFVNASVDNAFNNDDEGTDYEYIMRHSFKVLYNDKRFIGDKKLYKTVPPEMESNISYSVHEIICRYYDVTSSWAICYDYNENTFIYPMRQEFLKETLKGRDRIGGRKRVLPTVVKGHKRGAENVSSHLRAYGGDIVMEGRRFDILVGADSFSQIFPDNKYGHRKMMEMRKLASSVRPAN